MTFPKVSEASFTARAPSYVCPFILDAKLQGQLERLAEKKGKNVGEVVNQLVQKEVELIEEFS